MLVSHVGNCLKLSTNVGFCVNVKAHQSHFVYSHWPLNAKVGFPFPPTCAGVSIRTHTHTQVQRITASCSRYLFPKWVTSLFDICLFWLMEKMLTKYLQQKTLQLRARKINSLTTRSALVGMWNYFEIHLK